jgi:hypothetical protein
MSTLGPFCAGCLDFKNFCSCIVNFEDSTEKSNAVATKDNSNSSPVSVCRYDHRDIEHFDASEDSQAASQGHVLFQVRPNLSESHRDSESKAQTVSTSDYDGEPGNRLGLGFGESEEASPLVRAESNITGVLKYHRIVIACVINNCYLNYSECRLRHFQYFIVIHVYWRSSYLSTITIIQPQKKLPTFQVARNPQAGRSSYTPTKHFWMLH